MSALLALPLRSNLTHDLAGYAVFAFLEEPQGVGQGTAALARPSVFTETCGIGCFTSSFRAALFTVVDVAWVRHGWWEAGVVLGVVL